MGISELCVLPFFNQKEMPVLKQEIKYVWTNLILGILMQKLLIEDDFIWKTTFQFTFLYLRQSQSNHNLFRSNLKTDDIPLMTFHWGHTALLRKELNSKFLFLYQRESLAI